jgi:hypothetical protein
LTTTTDIFVYRGLWILVLDNWEQVDKVDKHLLCSDAHLDLCKLAIDVRYSTFLAFELSRDYVNFLVDKIMLLDSI